MALSTYVLENMSVGLTGPGVTLSSAACERFAVLDRVLVSTIARTGRYLAGITDAPLPLSLMLMTCRRGDGFAPCRFILWRDLLPRVSSL